MKKLLIVGSNSIHSKRYITGVNATNQFDLMVITNHKMAELDVPQVTVNFTLHNLRAVKQILSYLKAFKPEVVHIHQANSYAWHTLRAIKRLNYCPKVVLTTWGSDVLILPTRNRIFHRIVTYSLRHADVITADALFMSAKIGELLGKVMRPIYTLNFGIESLPALPDLTIKKKIILSTRLHKPLYQIDAIIDAFYQLKINQLIDNSYVLLVAAAGDELTNLESLVNKLDLKDSVVFSGMLSYQDLVKHYQEASIFVSVPKSDGTASSLLEAMAYGCIPVLSNLPANLEWVLDGINGFIAADIGQLAQQILHAVMLSENSKRYRELADFNYQLISKKANFTNNLQKFIELYN